MTARELDRALRRDRHVCDAGLVFLVVAAEQATRKGAFEGFFGQAFHRAALANAPIHPCQETPSLRSSSPGIGRW